MDVDSETTAYATPSSLSAPMPLSAQPQIHMTSLVSALDEVLGEAAFSSNRGEGAPAEDRIAAILAEKKTIANAIKEAVD